MGRDKALLTYRGQSFLESIIAVLGEAGIARVAVVLGHHAEEIRRAANLEGVEVALNPHYRRGQTSSLQCGLRALEDSALEAIVLCLVDHPAVSATTIRKLVQAFRQNHSPIVIPTHQGQRGHPVLINRSLFDNLLSLRADEGANQVTRKHQEATQFVEVDDPGILLDVDSPDAYRSLAGT